MLLELLNDLPSCAGVVHNHEGKAEQLLEVCYDSDHPRCASGIHLAIMILCCSRITLFVLGAHTRLPACSCLSSILRMASLGHSRRQIGKTPESHCCFCYCFTLLNQFCFAGSTTCSLTFSCRGWHCVE